MVRQENCVPLGVRTVSGELAPCDAAGAMQDYGNYAEIVAQLRVTAHEGTGGTLDVMLQHSVDDGDTWADLKGFDQVTTEDGAQQIAMSRWDFTGPIFFGNRLRVKWTAGGESPSFTFRVDWVLKG